MSTTSPKPKRESYWKTHAYHRGSVDRDVEEFVGWKTLLKMCVAANDEMIVAIIATLFETGGRVSEVLLLRRNNFLDAGAFIIVKNMPVLKKKSKSMNGAAAKFRTFPIKRTEPLAPIMEAWIKKVKTPDGLLFESRYESRKGEAMTRQRVWQLVKEAGAKCNVKIYPHWFRAQRASQLSSDYGWKIQELLTFFKWKNIPTALRYSHLGWHDLANRMKPPPVSPS